VLEVKWRKTSNFTPKHAERDHEKLAAERRMFGNKCERKLVTYGLKNNTETLHC
jgi:hypothetical protein